MRCGARANVRDDGKITRMRLDDIRNFRGNHLEIETQHTLLIKILDFQVVDYTAISGSKARLFSSFTMGNTIGGFAIRSFVKWDSLYLVLLK